MKKDIDVSVIRSKGWATLVETYDPEGNPVRVSILSDSVDLSEDSQHGKTDKESLEMGIEFGIPWEFRLRSKTFSARDISNALHRNGIWTSDDVVNHPDAVKGALLEVLRQTLTDINQIAKEFRSKET